MSATAPGGPPPAKATVGLTSLLLVPIALVARGAAFVVPALVALWFGVGEITDAWFWALAFPTFALVLASTSLGTAITPVLARVARERRGDLPAVLGGLLLHAALGSALFGLTVCLAAPAFLARLTDFAPDTVALAVRFLWGLLPFMVLTTCAAVLRVACEVHAHYTAVALTPILRAGVVILVTGLSLRPLGPMALPAGLVSGEVAQLLFWGGVLSWKHGLRPHLTLRIDPAVRSVASDLAPILGGEVLVALNLVIDKAFAATLPPGSVATLEYADRARVIPQTLLESTLLMVAFATWARLFAQGEVQAARASVRRSLSWVVALGAPVLAGMFIGRQVLVGLLFERGAFGPEDTANTSALLAWYLPGVLPNLVGILAVRAHVVERNLRLVFILGVLSIACNTILNVALIGPMGLHGLALSTTLTMTIVPAAYLWALWSAWGPEGEAERRDRRFSIGVALASAAIAVVVELAIGPPASLLDPVLWIAAVPCLALAGAALLRQRGATSG